MHLHTYQRMHIPKPTPISTYAYMLYLQAKHEVDSIASLRAVREWSTSVTRLEKAGTGIQGMLQHTINLVAKR